MTSDKLSRFWLIATFLLIFIIIFSSFLIWMRHDNGEPLVISPPLPPQTQETFANVDTSSQKIDLNRADLWLLESLPDIGEVRAQAIIDYRTQNGPFRNIIDLTKVPSISQSTFNKIKDLVTITE
jgi:competence ComEA-like helix-hairpin-helix protein